MNDLGQKIRQARRVKGLTQEQLADAMHVSRQTISHWENNRTLPDYLLLCELAKTLETDVVAFLQELPAGPEAEEAEAAEALPAEAAEETALPDPAPVKRRLSLRQLLLIAAALLVLLVGTGTVVCLRSQPEPSGYTAAWFMEQPPAAENAAFLHTYCLESPIQARQRRPDATPMYQFSIYIREKSVGCTMDSITLVYFCGDRVLLVDALAQEDFINLGLVTPYLAGNHMRRISMGMPAGEDTGIGIHITGTDDNGNPMESRCYLPLEKPS